VGVDPQDDSAVLSDGQIEEIEERFVAAAVLAGEVGFDFVDIKHCHGYLGHELLSGHTRPGRYGGSLANRTRFLESAVSGIRRRAPGLGVAVRISAFDMPPFQRDESRGGLGVPEDFQKCLPYDYGFGVSRHDPMARDLAEPLELLQILRRLGVELVSLSCGSPYYTPHILRPAFYPPSDGYGPPEDPLVGVARQIAVARELHRSAPGQVHVGSGYSYLQRFLPLVAQAVVREDWISMVGIGREVLSYPQLPADVLQGRPLRTNRLCRTFSDCTTAPRHGLRSGCYALDEQHRKTPEGAQVRRIVAAAGLRQSPGIDGSAQA
jgi:2,4-dienoyl-CoA reductase-like NADH-dependent reductase (Old Yellow Enzyme family)